MTTRPIGYWITALSLALLSACGGSPPEGLGVVADSSATETPTPEEAPPPPPSSAFIALLSPAQTQQIRSLGVPLVVPTAIPAGFVVDQVKVTPDERFTNYQILYRDSSDRCFLVEYTAGGVGGIPTTEYRLPINPPLIDDGVDYGLNYGHYTDPALKAQFPQPELMSDWLPLEKGLYRLAGAAYINDTLTPPSPCTDISPEEAVTLIESFAEISSEIVGDG